MTISEKSWVRYIDRLRKVNKGAAEKMLAFLETHKDSNGLWDASEVRQAVIDYAYGLSTTYGEAAAELACEMYDEAASLSGVALPSAEPAATATYGEVAKQVNGTLKYQNPQIISQAVERLVKLSEVDTVLNNALRDGAEWAWIPHGDTCPYCITLASQGWQYASKEAIRDGHAEHVHANCDCTYAVRFNEQTNVEGYNPNKYKRIYDHADGRTGKDKIRAMYREEYARNKDEINARKRAEYAARKEREEA